VADSHFYIGGEETQLFIVSLSESGEPGDLIELHAGRLKVGAAETDDIYLNLVGVAPSHFSFVYLDGHITVLSANHEIRLGGVVQKQFPFEWPLLQVISLGSAHLTYGTSQGPWPELPEMQEALVEELVEDEQEYVPPVKRTVKEHAVISARRGAIVVATAVGVIILGLGINFLFGSRDIVSPNDRSIESAQQGITRLLESDKEHLSSVKLEKRIDGALSITGFVDDAKSYALLADEIRNESIKTKGNVRFDALSKDKLSEQIKDLIGNYPLKYTLTISGKDIYAEITGIKTPDLDLANLKNQLERINDRVEPRIFHYSITTLDPVELTKTINSKLASSPLTRTIKFEIKNKAASLKGLIAASSEEMTMPLIRNLVAKEMTSFPVVVDVVVDQKINFQVSSIITGAQIAVANLTFRGKTESREVGQDVFGQGELIEIRKDGVVVSSRSKELFVPVTYAK
jgi:hypothetical protein